jgi:hypothetical protein
MGIAFTSVLNQLECNTVYDYTRNSVDINSNSVVVQVKLLNLPLDLEGATVFWNCV